MIVFFGQPGAGKTTQGKMLAASQGWCWISAGQLLRDCSDPEVQKKIETGELVPSKKVSELIGDALNNCSNINHVIIDGFARKIKQASWLIQNGNDYNREVELVIVISVLKSELIERLSLRGRKDDTEKVIKKRLDIYGQETAPVLDYFKQQGIKIAHIDGSGTPEQVHERIMKEVKKCKLV